MKHMDKEYNYSKVELTIFSFASYFFGYGFINFLLFVNNYIAFTFGTFMRFLMIPLGMGIVSLLTNRVSKKNPFTEWIIGGIWIGWCVWHFIGDAYQFDNRNYALFIDWLFLILQTVFAIALGLTHIYQGMKANRGESLPGSKFSYGPYEQIGMFLTLILTNYGLGFMEQTLIFKDSRFTFYSFVCLLYAITNIAMFISVASKAWLATFISALCFEFCVIYMIFSISPITFAAFTVFLMGFAASGINIFIAYKQHKAGKEGAGEYNLLAK